MRRLDVSGYRDGMLVCTINFVVRGLSLCLFSLPLSFGERGKTTDVLIIEFCVYLFSAWTLSSRRHHRRRRRRRYRRCDARHIFCSFASSRSFSLATIFVSFVRSFLSEMGNGAHSNG